MSWNDIVKSFKNWDIYYLREYAMSFQLHGDGEPLLIDYHDDESRFCYVIIKSDIASDYRFRGKLDSNKYFDYETPYGYGGPLCDNAVTENSQEKFLNEIKEYMLSLGGVSQFIRFHPLFENQNSAPQIFESRYLHDTVYIDTTSPELIVANMDSKNRNMVRKAIKNGITIERKSIDDYKDFVPMYTETMLKNNADDYYLFNEEYFMYQQNLKDNACIFYAIKDGQPVAGAIMYYNNNFMHYHLAGTHSEFRKFSPSNLLLYEAACWASKQGISKFHLGGGIAQDDNLFSFKKQFNKKGQIPFFIGRTIFNNNVYKKLMDIRTKSDINFDSNNGRMIQYRH